MTTALVLAGGGSFGAVQVGMLGALMDDDVHVDFVVGSSVGALNGAYFAGEPTREGVHKLASLWRRLRRQDIFPLTLATLAKFVLRRDFLFSSSGIRDLAERELSYRRLEDARVPIHIVATDFLSGGPVVLSEGSAADALVASTAIPAAFAAKKIGTRFLIDGAVTSNTPVRIAVTLGADELIVLPTGFACSLIEPPRGVVASAMHAMNLLVARQLVAELEGLPDTVRYGVAPTLCPLQGSAYDFARVDEMIETSESSTRAWLRGGGLGARSIPYQLRAHSHHAIHTH